MSAATAPAALERPAAAAALALRSELERARFHLERYGTVAPYYCDRLDLLLERMIVALPPSGPPA